MGKLGFAFTLAIFVCYSEFKLSSAFSKVSNGQPLALALRSHYVRYIDDAQRPEEVYQHHRYIPYYQKGARPLYRRQEAEHKDLENSIWSNGYEKEQEPRMINDLRNKEDNEIPYKPKAPFLYPVQSGAGKSPMRSNKLPFKPNLYTTTPPETSIPQSSTKKPVYINEESLKQNKGSRRGLCKKELQNDNNTLRWGKRNHGPPTRHNPNLRFVLRGVSRKRSMLKSEKSLNNLTPKTVRPEGLVPETRALSGSFQRWRHYRTYPYDYPQYPGVVKPYYGK